MGGKKEDAMRLVQTAKDGASKLLRKIPEVDPHFPVENVSKNTFTFGGIQCKPGETVMLPMDWALELSSDRDFKVFLATPAKKVEENSQIVLKRHVGWGDMIFALAATWHLHKLNPTVDIWFQVPHMHDEWLEWVPFVTSGVPMRPDNFINLDAIDHCAKRDRVIEMVRSLGLPYTGKNKPKFHFPIDVPEGPAPGFPQHAPYGYLAPWSRDKFGARSMPEDTMEHFLKEYTQRCNIPLVIGDSMGHNLRECDGRLVINKTFDDALKPAQKMQVINNAKFVISMDTGPLHVATLLRRPVVGIFTFIDPAHRLSLVESPYEVVTPDLKCFPCGDAAPHPCQMLDDRDADAVHRCTKAFSAEDIFRALARLREKDGELAAHLSIRGIT